MPAIKLDRFGGSTHLNAPHLISKPHASYALNCNFDTGALTSFYDTKPVVDDDTMQLNDGEKWIQVGCCWVKVPICTDFADGAVECSTYYFTGHNSYPEEAQLNPDTCELVFNRLGLPCPTEPPTIEFNQDDCVPVDCQDGCLDKDVEARAYVYQFVNSRGQRSSVSPPSKIELINDGTRVLVSGWERPDPSWDITTVRIYRTVSGYSQGTNQVNNQFDTTYMFVGEVPITQAYFIDDKINYVLTDALEETGIVSAPPTNLKGIRRIPNQNVLVGYANNRVYFTRNNQWWNWSIYLTLDHNIRGLVVSGDMVYVATDGVPYAIAGSADCNTADCRQVVKHEIPYPYIGCDNNGMTAVQGGAVYPTNEGLVYLSGNNTPVILTQALYSVEAWQRLRPDTAKPIMYKEYLYIFFADYACRFKLKGNDNNHTSLSDTKVIYPFVSLGGELYLVKKDNTYIWERGDNLREHKWVSPEIMLDRTIGFAFTKVNSTQSNEFIKIRLDDRTCLKRLVNPSYPMALPLWSAGNKLYIQLKGTGKVASVSISTSFEEV